MTDPNPDPQVSPDGEEATETKAPRDAREELFEAIDHFKNAASILFDRAAKDPTVKTATHEAERIITKIGEHAEPLAKQLTGELDRLTKRISDSIGNKRRND